MKKNRKIYKYNIDWKTKLDLQFMYYDWNQFIFKFL